MSNPTRRQFKKTTQASLTALVNVATLDSVAEAGNLLVICLAGDKNTGTGTVTDNTGAGTWNELFRKNATNNNVSLYFYWKVAVGGETQITLTTGSAPSTGNTGYVEEMVDDGSGVWTVVASISPAITAAGTISSGTTDTADYDGRAIAMVVWDSINTMTGTVTWTNEAYTQINTPETLSGSGGGNAGCWVATRDIAAGATTSTTFAASAGSDDIGIAIGVFGKVESGTPTAPTVGAGADVASHTVNTVFSRTATENDNGSPITSRGWTIQSGPAGAGTTIDPDAVLAWTPTVTGTYVLRYTATNSIDSSFDELSITVATPAPGTLANSWIGVDTIAVKVTGHGAGAQQRIGFSTQSNMAGATYTSLKTPDSRGVTKHTIPALTPGSTYYYRPESAGQLIGIAQQFSSLPGTDPTNFSFAFSSCRHHTNASPSSNPTAFTNAKGRGVDLFLEIGDFHYSDLTANDQVQFHAAYDELFTESNIADVLRSVPTDYVWDDHDTGGDSTNGSDVVFPAAQAVYRSRVPHPALPHANGIYHTFVIGRIRFVVLDCRSFRSAVTDAEGASKTMLGTAQKAWLQNLLDNPTTPVTCIVSSVGWVANPGVDTGQDHWGYYTTERAEIGGWITANSAETKVFFVSGDAHMLAYDDGTNAVAGTPQYHGGALNQTGSVKGGPYSGSTLAGSNQFGLIDVTDNGQTIGVTYSGIKTDNTVWKTHTFSVFAPEGGSGPEPGRFFLAYG